MAGPVDAFTLAQQILEAAAQSLDEAAPVISAPERQLVAYGVPVDEGCAQLAVHVNPISERLTAGATPGRRYAVAWLNQVVYTVTTSRCVPRIEVVGTKAVSPSADEITAAAREVVTEGWALWNGLHNRAQDLFGSCGDAQFGPMNARTPFGGRAGWTMDINVVLPGYRLAS